MIRTIVTALYEANFDEASLNSLARWQHDYNSEDEMDWACAALAQAEWGADQVSISESEGYEVISINEETTVVLCSHATEIGSDGTLNGDDSSRPHTHRFLFTDTPETHVLFFDQLSTGLRKAKNNG